MPDRLLNVSPDLRLPLEAVTQTFALLAVRRAGKALALDTPIPTPGGWTAMGDLQVGDVVFDEAGRPCTVTDAWPTLYERPCFAVRFSDGSEIVADAEHQWYADTKRSRRKYQDGWFNNVPADIYTTAQLAAAPKDASGRETNYSIRVCGPLRCPDADLPVPPYTMGAWLGDGTSATGSITSADAEILAEVEAEGETVWVIPSTVKANHASYRVKSLHPRLGALGLLGNKHIPVAYLRASETQRRALLAGLLDTDGFCGNRGHIEFCSTNERLASDVRHLVATLGYKATIRSKIARLYGKDCGTVWTISFRTPETVFRLRRKVTRQTTPNAQVCHRYVVEVRPVPSVPVRCIAVDSRSHLYLAGEACIPTHNSNAAAVMAEAMFAAGLPWVAIDPKGDWWGLRSNAAGDGPGLSVPIFGGLHGDLPLNPESGRLMSELIVEHNLTCILDVSRFSKAARIRFATDFALRLYEPHQADPQPRHIFLEEADRLLPQRVTQDMAPCVGAYSDLIRLGGAFGLGVTLISQRAAVINKDGLTQVETMVAMRTTSPQDRKAIHDWMEHHAIAAEIVESLPGLVSGEAWVSSSFFLAEHGHQPIQRIRFRQRRTFDSGATPKLGQQRRVATLADIDLGALADRMADVVERAAQDDPKALRKRIAELERQLAAPRKDHAEDLRELVALRQDNESLHAQLAEALAKPGEPVEVPFVPVGLVPSLNSAEKALREVTRLVAAALEAARTAKEAKPAPIQLGGALIGPPIGQLRPAARPSRHHGHQSPRRHCCPGSHSAGQSGRSSPSWRSSRQAAPASSWPCWLSTRPSPAATATRSARCARPA